MEKSKALKTLFVFFLIFVSLGFLLYAVKKGLFLGSDAKEPKLHGSLYSAAYSLEKKLTKEGLLPTITPAKSPSVLSLNFRRCRRLI